jgi:serine/threonine-protein kinase
MPTSPPSLPFHLDNRRYKCDTALGAGTFGRVFAATDQHLDIRVAIKTFANGVLITDVLREARLQARLTADPHVVNVRNVRVVPPVPFVVMDLVDGGSAESRLMAGTVDLLDAVRWTRDALGGLAHAHAMGVLHRDIKPANLLLYADRAALSDFGIAEETIRAALIRTTYGPHAAPEVLAGAASSASSDIFAMGCTLYRLVTFNHLPFASPADIMSGAFTDPHTLNPQVPLALTRLVRRALAHDPTERFQSAAAMREALSCVAIRAAWRPTLLSSSQETWECDCAAGSYRLTLVERPVAGPEVTLLLDRGSGYRRVTQARLPTMAQARRRRQTILRNIVQAGHH